MLPISILGAKKPKKDSNTADKSEASSPSVVKSEENIKNEFPLKPLEVVEPMFFTQNVEAETTDGNSENARNPTFRELPHYKDNEFETKRKRSALLKKWLGRQFLIVMGPNDYKEGREIIKSTEPDVYTNAALLDAYDFKRKLFPLRIDSGCIDIGAEYQRSADYKYFDETKYLNTHIAHQICLKSFLEVDFSFEKDKYPDYHIPIPEKEAEVLKASFDGIQIGIVAAWLPDDTREVKAETVDWGKFEYNGQLGSETFDRLELKWTAIAIFIRHGDKIYQSKLAPGRKPRFTLTGYDSTKVRQKFKEATEKAVKDVSE